ncbi:MAG TPA: zinc-dependent alcohol dehydrogenase family protein [Bacteroidota bacterium]|nr:zinc-dependent alcohol dehydrogenase family protein [Bacteroidota bacterium]
MKAALLNGPNSLTVTLKPIRKLEPGELLVKVDVCGVCGTDVHIVEGTSRSTPPVVLGHEYSGVVEDSGKTGGGQLHGRRVAVDPNIACGTCYFCRRGLVHLCSNLKALGVDIDGGMAEYSIVPERQIYFIPPAMAKETSAFIEPVSCAVHGIDRAGVKAGDTVIIIGGGTIGLIMLQLARNAGAASVIVLEPLEHKRRIATELGADVVLNPLQDNPSTLLRDAAIQGGDVVIECVGKPQTMQLAIELARRGGTVEFFGVAPIGEKIPLEPNQVYYKELTIVGSYVNPNTFDRSIALLVAKKVRVDLFQTDKFPLDGVHEALRYQREGITIKSIILPNS